MDGALETASKMSVGSEGEFEAALSAGGKGGADMIVC